MHRTDEHASGRAPFVAFRHGVALGVLAMVLVACSSSVEAPPITPPPTTAADTGSPEPDPTVMPSAPPTATSRPTRSPRPTPSPGWIVAPAGVEFDSTAHVGSKVSATLTFVNRGRSAISPTLWITPQGGLVVRACRPTCQLAAGDGGRSVATWPKLAPGKKRTVTVELRAAEVGQHQWALGIDSNADGTLDSAAEPSWRLTTYVFP